MHIDVEKVGLYIKKLRTSHNMTQDDLAEKLFLTRQAISRWEVGLRLPSIDSAFLLTEIFDVTIMDIYCAGENVNIKESNEMIHEAIDNEIKEQTYKRYIRLLIKVIITIIIVILVNIGIISYIFFSNNYKKVSNYRLHGEENNYIVNGIMNKSVNTLFFNISLNKEVDRFCISFQHDDVLCEDNSSYLEMYETIGYNESIPSYNNISIDNFLNNLSINIYHNDKLTNIKLFKEEIYQNNSLVIENDSKIIDHYKFDDTKIEVPNNIKDKFIYDKNENKYYLNIFDNTIEVNIEYYLNAKELVVKEIDNKILKEWNYDINNNNISSYKEININNNEILKKYNNFSNINSNKEEQEIYNYFIDKYLNKYINNK